MTTAGMPAKTGSMRGSSLYPSGSKGWKRLWWIMSSGGWNVSQSKLRITITAPNRIMVQETGKDDQLRTRIRMVSRLFEW